MKLFCSFRNYFAFFLFILLFAGIYSCNDDKKTKNEEDKKETVAEQPLLGYDLKKPEVINLSKKVDEISGMAYSASDNTIFAIDDNNGDLYNIALTKDPEIKKWKFGKNKDYEDLVLFDSTFYILESNGILHRFPYRFPITDVKQDTLHLKGFNEFETLYYDDKRQQLILFCKECEVDKKKSVSAYAFDIKADSFVTGPVLELKRKKLEKKLDKELSRIKASAGTINPLTGEIYIISSINKILVVADRDYNVKTVYKLDRKIFGQPEGICFAPDGTMFISNEAAEGQPANILVFKNQ